MLDINKELLKKKVILYVEDDVSTADEVSFFLRAYVKELYVAKDGKEGLELFNSHPIDLVLTDIQMPVMNGLKMIQQIRAINKNIPIMITTAFNETTYLIEALNMGVNKYALKPINLKELLKTIETLLEEFDILDYNYYLDMNAKVIEITQELLDYLGYTRDEVVGHNSFDFVKDEDLAAVKVHFDTLRKGISTDNIDFSIKRKNRSFVEILINATPIFDKNGNVVKVHCELKSIETYVKSEKKLQIAFEKEHFLRKLITIDSQIAQIITHEISKDAFLQKAIKIIKENGQYEFACITLKDGEKSFRLVSQTQHPSLDIGEILQDYSKVAHKKGIICGGYEDINDNYINIVYDIAKIPEFFHKEKLISAGIKSIVEMPIISIYNKETIGFVGIFFNKIHTLSKDEIDMYKNIVETISLGIENINMNIEKEELIKKLELEASTDQLTKATNRRQAFNVLAQEIERSNRYGHELSLIYLDIDDFKLINDSYGHEAGDRALISLTKIIEKMIRVSDTFARWGGEEFIVILPETSREDAVQMAEKFRKEIASSEKFTVSFGVSTYRAQESIDEFIIDADKNMYKAKISGKNRVVYA
jgi:diguanylate cyclase (GGDEF)-like protein/PAS domain S-box-containing protein